MFFNNMIMKPGSSSVALFVLLLFLSKRYSSAVDNSIENYAVKCSAIKSNLASYAGFLNGTDASKMFFWFFPSESKNRTDPLIVWLQGDVGTSSLKGLFENNGPFYVKLNKGTKSRKSYWSKSNNVLYIDTTVGTGYSHFKETRQVYPANMDQLVLNIFNSLTNFFRIFYSFKNNDLYLAGDGFACLILTKLAKKIDQTNTIRLKGLIIENGFCDPFNAVPVTNYLFSLRMFDSFRQTKMFQAEKQILDLMRNNKYEEAFDKYDDFIKGLLTSYSTLFNNNTHYESTHNLLYDKEYRVQGNFSDYVMKDGIKRILKIPENLAYSDGKTVLKKLRGELMKSPLTELGRLMDKYRVLMYFGQMNPEITPKGTFLTASSIKWCGGKFFGDMYSPWFVNSSLTGYIATVKTADCKEPFTWALVRNAGKNIAGEMPQEVSDLIRMFTSDIS